MKFFQIITAGVALGLALTASVRAEQNVTIDGVLWRVNYTGDFLPNNPLSDPAFTTLFTSGSATAQVSGGVLRFTSLANSDQAWAEMENTTYWNSLGTNTVEFRMRLQSADVAYLGGGLYVFDGSQYYFFGIFEDEPGVPGSQGYVSLGDGSNVTVDVDSYHTYRIVTTGGSAMLYINGVAAYGANVGPTGVAGANRISFGDLTGAGGGISDWDYLRWTNAGAFPPVPEPQTAVLVLIGAAAAVWKGRRVLNCRS